MPDILIRGMEMPKNCGGCYLNHGEFCFMLCRKLILPQEWEARPSNCPLVELQPHGDLIDRDGLCADLVSNHPVVIYAKNAPVVVPASEEVKP